MTVRRPAGAADTWGALPGETRWADHTAAADGAELVVYVHLFRRVRERATATHDLLIWKPATTRVAHRYAAGEWTEVVDAQEHRPPTGVETVPRRTRSGRRRAPDDAV